MIGSTVGQLYFVMKEFSQVSQHLESLLKGLEKIMGDTSPVPVAGTAKRLYLFTGGILLIGLVAAATIFYFRLSKRNAA